VARIFALADVFDALCARRPYKEPMPLEAAMQVLTEGSGNHFDPHLVQVFSKLAQHIHRTIIHASEDEARTLLEVMVRKHFGL
jgi:HD-GYP domain-containing protein (c-di-GMP phosphodiesterase class II)